MTLRARLLVALLAMALAPTAILTLFTLDQLNRAIGRWYRPGVDRALESALAVTKETLTRLEATVMTQAADWAALWPPGSPSPPWRSRLRAALASAGLDFAQVYRESTGHWRRIEQLTPAGVLLPAGPDLSGQIPAALGSGQPVHSAQGALAGVSRLADGDVLVVGMSVSPGLFSELDQVVHGVTYYRQLGVYVDLQRRVIGIMVGGMVLVLAALAVLLAGALARGMSRPLRDLSQAIERVAAGDLATRVAPRGARELRSLGRSFNTMTERLEAARRELQRAEREAAWRDVARTLAHEFKNLLTPMQLSLQRVESKMVAVPVEQREAVAQSLKATLREVENLNRLAEQFSQYARLPEPRFELVELSELVRAAAAFDPQREIRVSGSGTAAVLGDRLLLSRALHNLLLNACEASPPGSAVELSARVEGERACVEVLDRGLGLPEELADRLFEPYVSTKRRGSGLGLSLVRDIALQHRGTVSLANRPGGGVRACLCLPLAPAPEGRPA